MGGIQPRSTGRVPQLGEAKGQAGELLRPIAPHPACARTQQHAVPAAGPGRGNTPGPWCDASLRAHAACAPCTHPAQAQQHSSTALPNPLYLAWLSRHVWSSHTSISTRGSAPMRRSSTACAYPIIAHFSTPPTLRSSPGTRCSHTWGGARGPTPLQYTNTVHVAPTSHSPPPPHLA